MKWMGQLPAAAKALLILAAAVPLLAGCWDSSNLENVEYVTAIGIDREDGGFVFYAQLIDLSTIAKTESGGRKDAVPVWIGQGKGRTVYDAYDKLLRSAQSELSLEQLKVIVVRNQAMGSLTEILDAINRVRVSRYTSWVFGTKSPIIDIFSTDLVLERSQLHSLLYSPQQQMKSNTFVQPLKMQKFVSNFNEHAVTALLPSIQVTDRAWRQDKENIQVGMIDGLFAFKKKKHHFYGRDQIAGIRWLNPQYRFHRLPVQNKEGGAATVAVSESKSKVKIALQNGQPHFTLHMKLKGELAETEGSIHYEEIVQAVQTKVADELIDVFTIGAKNGDDLLNLEEKLFRYRYKEWKKLNGKGGWQPKSGDLKVKVDFILQHAGSFQLD